MQNRMLACIIKNHLDSIAEKEVVVGDGFEPSKAKPADLQSAPVGHLGNLPKPLKSST